MKLGKFKDLAEKRFSKEKIAQMNREVALEAEVLPALQTNMNRLIDYQEYLLETLKDRQAACDYLNAAIQDEDPRIFILALNNVLEAQLDKEHLQSIYPVEGDPTLARVKAALNALGVEIRIQMRSAV